MPAWGICVRERDDFTCPPQNLGSTPMRAFQFSPFPSPPVTFKGSPSALSNGFDLLRSPFAESVEIFPRHQMAPLLSMTMSPTLISLRPTTILLRVRLLGFEASHLPVTKALVLIGEYNLVDHKVLNLDRMTSSEQTPRRSRFRDDVVERDGSSCHFTGVSEELCDAAHIVPRSKGDEVRSRLSHLNL
jgi:hypothetical protein